MGPINASGRVFLSKLGRKLADQSGDDREISFLFQRLSVLIQRYNAILLHDCFVKEEEEEKGSFQLDFCTFSTTQRNFFNSLGLQMVKMTSQDLWSRYDRHFVVIT